MRHRPTPSVLVQLVLVMLLALGAASLGCQSFQPVELGEGAAGIDLEPGDEVSVTWVDGTQGRYTVEAFDGRTLVLEGGRKCTLGEMRALEVRRDDYGRSAGLILGGAAVVAFFLFIIALATMGSGLVLAAGA